MSLTYNLYPRAGGPKCNWRPHAHFHFGLEMHLARQAHFHFLVGNAFRRPNCLRTNGAVSSLLYAPAQALGYALCAFLTV